MWMVNSLKLWIQNHEDGNGKLLHYVTQERKLEIIKKGKLWRVMVAYLVICKFYIANILARLRGNSDQSCYIFSL